VRELSAELGKESGGRRCPGRQECRPQTRMSAPQQKPAPHREPAPWGERAPAQGIEV